MLLAPVVVVVHLPSIFLIDLYFCLFFSNLHRPESRLCHACSDEFRRQGRNRCSKCPLEGQNYGLLGLAVLLLIVGGVAVVWMAIKDAGKAEQSEIIRKVK